MHKVKILKWRGSWTQSEPRLKVTCPEDGLYFTAWASWDGDDFSVKCACGEWVESRQAA